MNPLLLNEEGSYLNLFNYFDKIEEFKYYFPHNNISFVLKKYINKKMHQSKINAGKKKKLRPHADKFFIN